MTENKKIDPMKGGFWKDVGEKISGRHRAHKEKVAKVRQTLAAISEIDDECADIAEILKRSLDISELQMAKEQLELSQKAVAREHKLQAKLIKFICSTAKEIEKEDDQCVDH